jgi:hypothetical protein
MVKAGRMATRLTIEQVNSWRLTRHHLVHRADRKEIAKIVSDACGIQAQVLSAAELAIRARVEGLCEQDVRAAMWKYRTILKTWCMRGSVHLLARADLPLYVAALKTKLAESARWLQKDGQVTPEEIETITEAVGRALTGRTLTREQLSKEVERIADLSPRAKRYLMSAWGILLRPAAYQGMLAFGESVGPLVTFVRPDLRDLCGSDLSALDALLKLFRRFLSSYGPATIGDFTHWWGSLSDEYRSGLERYDEGLVEVETEGHRVLMLEADADAASGLGPLHVLRLLPSFDCYAMLYSPRERFVPDIYRGRIFRAAGWNYPTIMADGVAIGIWGFRKRGRGVVIELEPFRPFNAREKKSIQEEVADIGKFLDISISCTLPGIR